MIKPTEPEIAISNRKDTAKFLYKQQYTKFIYELAKKVTANSIRISVLKMTSKTRNLKWYKNDPTKIVHINMV